MSARGWGRLLAEAALSRLRRENQEARLVLSQTSPFGLGLDRLSVGLFRFFHDFWRNFSSFFTIFGAVFSVFSKILLGFRFFRGLRPRKRSDGSMIV